MPFDSQYTGPTEWAEIPKSYSKKGLRILKPSAPDGLLNDPTIQEWNRSHDYMPYWAYLWPGSFLLAQAIATRDWGADASAIELGCGLGLAGIVGLAAGLRVHFTDHDRAPLAFVEQSLVANQFEPSRYGLSVLDWESPSSERYDVILGADLLYEQRLVPLVVNLIDRMLAAGGVALLAGPERSATEAFPSQVQDRGFRVERESIEAVDLEGRLVQGHLHTVRRL